MNKHHYAIRGRRCIINGEEPAATVAINEDRSVQRIVGSTTLRDELIYQDGQFKTGPLGQPILKAQAA